jgi:hypothetical protein
MTRVHLAALAVVCGLCLLTLSRPAPAFSQVLESLDKAEPGEHAGHGDHHHLHLPLGEATSTPDFTYTQDTLGPAN